MAVTADVASSEAQYRELRSSARWKMFILSSFDAMLVTIIWLLIIKTSSLSRQAIPDAFKECDAHCFNNSVLDVVGLSILRFIVLTTSYTVLASLYTWPVVLCTAGSSVYLICKVYLYSSRITQEWDYAIFISSFVVSWAEVFLHASAIVPLRKLRASSQLSRQRGDPAYDERAPLLLENGRGNGYYNGSDVPRGILIPGGSRSAGASTPGSINQYSTPVQSDVDSDVFGTPKSAGTPIGTPMMGRARSLSRGALSSSALPLSPEGLAQLDERLINLNRRGEDAVQDTWEMAVGEQFQWNVELEKSGIIVSSTTIGSRTVLRAEGLIRVSPSVLFHILYAKEKSRTSWNPIIERFEVLEDIDRFTDITYSVSAAQARGLVSPRDFVCVRQWLKRDGNMVIAQTVTEHPKRLASDGATVRGDLGPGGYVLLSVPGQPNVTNLVWIFNVDLKGWIPRYVVEQTMVNLLAVHHERVRSLVPQSTSGQPRNEIYI
eukprot:m.143029 g.143029  ORF g.143029 m.143029 type:complete len:491 (-) comp22958_c0_seq1:2546-4018(-)